MENLTKNLAGAIACTFVTMEDAETAYNFLINRHYSPDQIHVLVPSSFAGADSKDCIQLVDIFQNGEILSDGIVVSGSLKSDPALENTTTLKRLTACGIADLHANRLQASLLEKQIILMVNPVNEKDREEISQEFNYYKGKQIHGSEAYTV
jgi:hypothetical protein